MNIPYIIFFGVIGAVSGLPWELCGLAMLVGFVVTEVYKAWRYN